MIESSYWSQDVFLNKKIQHHKATFTSAVETTTEVETYYQEMDKSSSPQIIIHLRCPFGTAFVDQTIFWGGMRDFLVEDWRKIVVQSIYRLGTGCLGEAWGSWSSMNCSMKSNKVIVITRIDSINQWLLGLLRKFQPYSQFPGIVSAT